MESHPNKPILCSLPNLLLSYSQNLANFLLSKRLAPPHIGGSHTHLDNKAKNPLFLHSLHQLPTSHSPEHHLHHQPISFSKPPTNQPHLHLLAFCKTVAATTTHCQQPLITATPEAQPPLTTKQPLYQLSQLHNQHPCCLAIFRVVFQTQSFF